jgi:hypothetical protein
MGVTSSVSKLFGEAKDGSPDTARNLWSSFWLLAPRSVLGAVGPSHLGKGWR